VKLNPGLPLAKATFNKKKKESFHQQIGLKFKEGTVKCYICCTALHGAVNLDNTECTSAIPGKF
jgi:hypothetical protein